MEHHPGGREQRVVMLSRAREQPLPTDVARLLSHLAHVLDDTIEARGVGIGVRDFAESFLGVRGTDAVVSSADAAGLTFHLAALSLAEDLDRHTPAGLIGEDQEETGTDVIVSAAPCATSTARWSTSPLHWS